MMLRLGRNSIIFINPGHIVSVDLFKKNVSIHTSDDKSRIVRLETEEQAKCFAVYVELLVDITNGQTTGKNAIKELESYFEEKGVLTPGHRNTALNKIRKESNRSAS